MEAEVLAVAAPEESAQEAPIKAATMKTDRLTGHHLNG